MTQPAEPKVIAQIVITFTAEGLTVTGHINDKILAYGLLEQAKDSLRDYHADLAKSGLTVVRQPLNGNGA